MEAVGHRRLRVSVRSLMIAVAVSALALVPFLWVARQTALVRAHFCEQAGEQLAGPRPGELFTLGLFSVIDALMDAPIDEVVGMIPFPSDMRDALIQRKGEKGKLLDCVTALEAGDFDRAQRLVRGAGDLYVEALVWANDAAEALFRAGLAYNKQAQTAEYDQTTAGRRILREEVRRRARR